MTLSRNLTWEKHVKEDKASIHKRMRKRLAALRFLGKHISIKRRIILANGLLNSLLVYGIQLWGVGATKRQISQSQSIQAQAARWALGLSRRTSTIKVLSNIGWLSVRQLVTYHSVLLLWKSTRGEGSPFHGQVNWETSCTMGSERIRPAPYRKEFRRKSWRPMAIAWWNALPVEARTQPRLGQFKRQLRTWVSANIPIK